MKFNLRSMTRKELVKLQRDVEKAIEKLAEKDKKAALAAAEKAAASHGFALADILADGSVKPRAKKSAAKKSAAKTSAAPKFRNPDDNSQTWTGKGRQPGWYKDAIAAGKAPETMAI